MVKMSCDSYRGDGGGSGNSRCGRRTHSPVKKKVSRVKKQKQKTKTKKTYQRLETCRLKPHLSSWVLRCTGMSWL